MTITCTAPNGAKFVGHAELWVTQSGYQTEVSLHNANERSSVQRALETWCAAMQVSPEASEAPKGKP